MKLYGIPLLIFICILSCSKGKIDNNGESHQPRVEEPDTDGMDDEEENDPDTEGSDNDEDWKTIPVPADPGSGKVWQFQEISDDFEYKAPRDDKGANFLSKWDDFYHNTWTGPGLTEWNRSFSFVADGLLQIPAERKPGSDEIYTGCITSKTRVVYPVYVEARAKTMNAVLANAIWLLSPDDTQEIDLLEAYGASFSESANRDHSWFAERIHVSHHVFIREPFTDYQPTDSGSWYTDGTTLWREEFHRYGVYWRDPWHLEYYIDGQLVRTVSGKDIIDPLYHTNEINQGDTSTDTRTGLSKEMDILINVEDQDWRSSPASGMQADIYTPTDNELSNTENHTFRVDWIRIFKPVDQ